MMRALTSELSKASAILFGIGIVLGLYQLKYVGVLLVLVGIIAGAFGTTLWYKTPLGITVGQSIVLMVAIQIGYVAGWGIILAATRR